jgi:hypothetical protein
MMKRVLSDADPALPRNLTGIRCLHWGGTLLFRLGFVLLARDGLTLYRQGWDVDRAITTLAGILPPFGPNSVISTAGLLFRGFFEFWEVVPLSLLLLTLGWCARTLAKA